MIIVIGSVTVSESGLSEALRLSQQHVNRSRLEPGCISHAVHRDTEDSTRLVFVERWESMDALQQHFELIESSEFAAVIASLATVDPEMQLYESRPIPRH